MADFIDITSEKKEEYNKVVNHPLQSFEWGEFRKKTGVKVIRKALFEKGKIIRGFTLSLHKIPYSKFYAGYLPKSYLPDDKLLAELLKIGKKENCIYVQLEPNIIKNVNPDFKKIINPQFRLGHSFHPIFTKYTFILNLEKTEDELLNAMHPKTRYNIKIAQKHKVEIVEDNSDEAFLEYLRLVRQTTERQGFFAHNETYHKLMWETLKNDSQDKTKLTAHLFLAKYITEKKEEKTLVAWILFTFADMLYYPYGASSSEYRETMASNLMMWEAIKFGKKNNLKKFDMWGALSENPNKNDPWFGFHRFKQGYGGKLTEFIGNFDLVIKPFIYNLIKILDKTRWALLRAKAKIK